MFVKKVFGIVVILGKPVSRGTVRLASRDPLQPAKIDPAYFAEPADLDTMLAGVLKAQDIANQTSLAAWGNTGLSTGSRTKNKKKLKKWIYKSVMTTFHYCGSCLMGSGSNAVVDLRLRFNGLNNLRIADASVIPEIPVSALNSPSMMLGYRAAEFILQDRTLSASSAPQRFTVQVAS